MPVTRVMILAALFGFAVASAPVRPASAEPAKNTPTQTAPAKTAPAKTAPAKTQNAADELLGIRIGMTRDEVSERLKKLGTLAKDEGGPLGAKQFWELKKDPSYGWIALRYDDELRVQWMTAFARLDAKRHPVRYKDIGDPKQARLSGAYFYTWVLRGEGGADAHAVTARGTDPEVLASISVYRMTPGD